MEKLPQISKASKSNVILLKQEGYKNVEISKRLKLSEASVSRILQRNKQNLSLSSLKRSGRPRTTTPRTDCKIKQLCQKQPFISSSEIKRSMQELISVTTRTIRNRMHKGFKLPARKPLKKPLITPRMAQQRLEFCCCGVKELIMFIARANAAITQTMYHHFQCPAAPELGYSDRSRWKKKRRRRHQSSDIP